MRSVVDEALYGLDHGPRRSIESSIQLTPELEQMAVEAIVVSATDQKTAVSEIMKLTPVSLERAVEVLQDLIKRRILCLRAVANNVAVSSNVLETGSKWVRGNGRTMIEIINVLTALEGVSYESSWREVQNFCDCSDKDAEHILYYFRDQNILSLEAMRTPVFYKWFRLEPAA